MKLHENKNDPVINGYHSFYYQEKGGEKLKYRFFSPSVDNNQQKYPLVVHFHGVGSRGDNNSSQLRMAKKVTAGENAATFPCFVFAPQCPTDKKWVDEEWSALSHTMSVKPAEQMVLALAAIDKITKNYPIDTARIYVYGQSMGGFATWDILCRRPDLFAAAVPVCGGGDETLAKKIAHVPVWIFHGMLDPTVNVQRSRNMFAALKEVGGNPHYTEYPRVKHRAWSYSYSPKLFSWMFSQKKTSF